MAVFVNSKGGEAEKARFLHIGIPRDIADSVSLLARKEAGWISGQNIHANIGMDG